MFNLERRYLAVVKKALSSLLVFLLIGLLAIPAASAEVVSISKVEMVESHSAAIPEQGAWGLITLPFELNRNSEEIEFRYHWLRFFVERPEEFDDLAIYIEKYQFNMEVFFNGKRVAFTDVPEGKSASGIFHPFVVSIQESNWQEGKNRVDIRLTAGAPVTLLGDIYFGDGQELRSSGSTIKTLYRDVALFSIVICIFMAFFSFGLWTQRRSDGVYLIFSLSTLIWLVPMVAMALPYAPFDYALWWRLVFTCVDITALVLFIFVVRLLYLGLKSLELVLVSQTVLSAVAVFLVPEKYIIATSVVASMTKLLVLIYLFVLTLKIFLEKKDEVALWVLVAFGMTIPLIAHDFYFSYRDAQEGGLYDSLPLIQLSIPVILFVLFAYMIKRFASALIVAETLNDELEERVRRSAKALEKSFQENREFELREASYQTQQRIYQDLHDDVGSQLVSIIHDKSGGRSKDIAKAALSSLRQAISQSKSSFLTLEDLLEHLCEEAEVRTMSAGLSFEKKFASLPGSVLEQEIDPDVSFHLLRIIREAVTNVIKHARASSLTFAVYSKDDELYLDIIDDGNGFSDHSGDGNGISNMRYRAKEIGAQISWNLLDRGCCLNLVLKLSRM